MGRQRSRPSPRTRALQTVALQALREHGIRLHVQPVDSRRTLRLGLDLEAA
jgi:hypothetical protein